MRFDDIGTMSEAQKAVGDACVGVCAGGARGRWRAIRLNLQSFTRRLHHLHRSFHHDLRQGLL